MIVGEVPFDRAVMYQYAVGLAYLIIGLFVYFRRGSAHKARHFYVFCLVSFIFFCFHYTGKLNTFDKVIYCGNVAAGLFAPDDFPALLPDLPGAPQVAPPAGPRLALLYLPALLLFAVRTSASRRAALQIDDAAGGSALAARPRLDAARDAALPASAAWLLQPSSTGAPKTRSSGSS